MRVQTVDVQSAHGRVLCSSVYRPCGKKLLAKGHILSEEDINLLKTAGMSQIWVTEIDAGEVPEDDAVLEIAARVACGSVEIRPAAGGRANFFATEDCCVLVDGELLRHFNTNASVVLSTASNFDFIRAGERIASLKSAPFAIPRSEVDAVLASLDEYGPLLQARPVLPSTVAVLYTDQFSAPRARQLFESVMRQRLSKFGASQGPTAAVLETETEVATALNRLLQSGPAAVIIASTTVPAGPGDAVGLGMIRAGCQIERFLAPVEPGNLLLLGYRDGIPVLSAPGCFRSVRTSVIDVVLPPLLARYRVSAWEIANLGVGGLRS